MPVRTTLLAWGNLAAGANRPVFYSVPGETSLVKSIYGWSYSTAASLLSVQLRSAGGTQPITALTVQPNAAYSWLPWLAVPEGVEFMMVNQGNGIVTYAISGARLPGVVPPLPANKPGDSFPIGLGPYSPPEHQPAEDGAEDDR